MKKKTATKQNVVILLHFTGNTIGFILQQTTLRNCVWNTMEQKRTYLLQYGQTHSDCWNKVVVRRFNASNSKQWSEMFALHRQWLDKAAISAAGSSIQWYLPSEKGSKWTNTDHSRSADRIITSPHSESLITINIERNIECKHRYLMATILKSPWISKDRVWFLVNLNDCNLNMGHRCFSLSPDVCSCRFL